MKRAVVLIPLLLSGLSFLTAQDKRKTDSLRTLLASASADTIKISAWNELSFEYQKVNPDSALHFANTALTLSEKKGWKTGRATALHNIGNVNYFKGEFATALGFYEKALALRQEIGNKKNIARTIANTGHVHFARGDYDKAMGFYQRMFEMGAAINDARTLADANGNIANVHMMKGNYDKSLEFNLRSLKIREELNDTRGMEHSYNNIGGIYFNQGNDLKALEYIQKALQLQLRIGNKKGMADSYQNIGSIYYHLRNMDSAFAYFNRSMMITEELGSKTGIAGGYDNYGNIYKQNKQYAKAIEYHKKAADLYTEIGDQKGMANAYGNLGGDYTETGDYASAVTWISKALEIGKRTGAKYYIKNAYDYFVVLYKKMNMPSRALEYAQLSSIMGDSLLNEENARSIAEMQTRFDTEKKEREIELLQKDKSIQELQLREQEARNRRLLVVLYTLSGGLLLLGALIFFIMRGTREKKRINMTLERKNLEISRQKEIIEQKNTLITDSIDYARTLIESRLPQEEILQKVFTRHFIYERAAEIVSGNSWWVQERGKELMAAVIDCRQQGIPGAFLSIQSLNRLERLLNSGLGLTAAGLAAKLSEERGGNLDTAVLKIAGPGGEAELACNQLPVYYFPGGRSQGNVLPPGPVRLNKGDVLLFCTGGVMREFGEDWTYELEKNRGDHLFDKVKAFFAARQSVQNDFLVFGIEIA